MCKIKIYGHNDNYHWSFSKCNMHDKIYINKFSKKLLHDYDITEINHLSKQKNVCVK